MKKIFNSRKTGKIILSALTVLSLSLAGNPTVLACTTFIAGRAVTADGSRIIGRNDDSEDLDVVKIVRRPAFNKKAPWTFTSTETNFTAQLPAHGYSYLALPSAGLKPGYGTWDEAVLNDHQVCLTATESIYANPAALVADPYVKNGIDESVLPTIVIPYVSTALAGVEFLGSLLAQYGSTEGNAVVFADAKETWYMEIYTGHQWAAIRFPEDRYAVIANDSLLGNLDVTDTANVRTSPNLVKLAREHHFLQENNGHIHMAHTYGAPHRDYSQLRIWLPKENFLLHRLVIIMWTPPIRCSKNRTTKSAWRRPWIYSAIGTKTRRIMPIRTRTIELSVSTGPQRRIFSGCGMINPKPCG